MESPQKLTEPHGIIGVVVANPFLHQVVQQADTKRPDGGCAVFGFYAGGQNGVGDAVLIILHLLQREGKNLGQEVVVVGVFEIVT